MLPYLSVASRCLELFVCVCANGGVSARCNSKAHGFPICKSRALWKVGLQRIYGQRKTNSLGLDKTYHSILNIAYLNWKGTKGIPTKGIGKKTLKALNFEGMFREFQGIFRVFSGLFPYALCGRSLDPLN